LFLTSEVGSRTAVLVVIGEVIVVVAGAGARAARVYEGAAELRLALL
jgi:glucose-6-phosphate isomerase